MEALTNIEKVASFTDAWIETRKTSHPATKSMSHPLRMRGLKLMFPKEKFYFKTSHPLRMRGLKHIVRIVPDERVVASFTDAWIETLYLGVLGLSAAVASFTDAWIETSIRLISQTAQGVRPLRI